jgi:ABC-type thiamine transport system ATPase subunit
VPDLRVELDAEAPPLSGSSKAMIGTDGVSGRYPEALGGGEDRVAVARPRLLLVGRAGEEDFVVLDSQV